MSKRNPICDLQIQLQRKRDVSIAVWHLTGLARALASLPVERNHEAVACAVYNGFQVIHDIGEAVYQALHDQAGWTDDEGPVGDAEQER